MRSVSARASLPDEVSTKTGSRARSREIG